MNKSRRQELIAKYGSGRTTLSVPTAIHTNKTFVANRDDEFDGDKNIRKYAMNKARAAGINPSGKRYYHGMARPGKVFDPQAWIDDSGAKSEIKQKCEVNRFDCQGLVTSKVPGHEPADELGTPDTMGLAE